MAKKKSSAMAYFLNTGTSGSPTWAALGKGVTSLPLAYNPQVTTETYIHEDNATTSVDSYQVSAAIDISLWDATDAPAHAYLENLRRTRATGADAETQILEIDTTTTSPYTAQVSNAVVATDTFTVEGGKPQALSVTAYCNGEPIDGTAVITDGVPVFTAAGVSAIALSSIVPADGASSVARSASIVLTFNNAIKGESVSIITAAGADVAFSKSWSASQKVLTLTPTSTMAATTVHIVAVNGVTDIYGQVLASAAKDFTTAS